MLDFRLEIIGVVAAILIRLTRPQGAELVEIHAALRQGFGPFRPTQIDFRLPVLRRRIVK